MNDGPFVDRVVATIRAVRQGPAKPILIVGGYDARRSSILGAAAVRLNTETVNLGVSLPAAVLRQETDWSPTRTPPLISSLAPAHAPAMLLDHIEVLFAPSLKINVIELLAQVARRLPVCASWPGEVSNARLRYARRDHPESVDADPSRVIVIDITKTES